MKKISHRFLGHCINPKTVILIIGTFNPDTEENAADFFYGRNRNFLWQLLATAFNKPNLKGAAKEEKLGFIDKHKIDFIDLIAEVEVEEGQEANYYDQYLDSRISRRNDIINEIQKLKSLKKVCFTRRTFSGIPKMTTCIREIEQYCMNNNITFQYLPTPARFYSDAKQQAYTSFLFG